MKTLRLVPSRLVILAATIGVAAAQNPPPSVDVPLSLWTSPAWPDGKVFGSSFGLAVGDYDGDGWVDVFNSESGGLYRNLAGQDWQWTADLTPLLMPGVRYGAAFGDFDGNGLPDLATEPRKNLNGKGKLSLLENGGAGTGFREIAAFPWRIDVQPYDCLTETNNWADVDGDGWIELFMPTYAASSSYSTGNWLLKNLGPVTPEGKCAFQDVSAIAGTDNVPGANRPEGAQFVDFDRDGDLDLYCNEVIYQNVSSLGIPRFRALAPSESGVLGFGVLDEGAACADYDMDGDLDLLVLFTSAPWITVYENRGDGTFLEETSIVDQNTAGTSLGMSLEDWDGDGDMDWTTSGVFRRNRLVEDGVRHYAIATAALQPAWVAGGLPSWIDWDRDGDLDCAMGRYSAPSRMLRNDLYDASTPALARRSVRVRPLRPSSTVPLGLDNEFGATVEIVIAGGGDGHRRVKFTQSGSGYLNQNEYALTFGLPPTPQDLVFDVSVDFPVVSGRGIWRVDRRVNPVLGDLHLAALVDREIQVLRDGRVRVNGVEHAPLAGVSPTLAEAAGGLELVAPGQPLAAPTPAPFADAWAVLALSTARARGPIAVRELVLDGELDAPVLCDGVLANIVLWDVTDPLHPKSQASGRLALASDPRNHRTHWRTELVLEPRREYRIAARVVAFRPSPLGGPPSCGGVGVRGSALVHALTPTGVAEIASAPLDPTTLLSSVRYGY
jgi:hypothetical protein